MNFTQDQYEAYLHRVAPKDLLKQGAADAETRESDLHDKIIAECRRRGWIAIHSRMDAPTTTAKGVPDFIILADHGRMFMFEAKSKTGKLRPEQIGFAMMAEQLGFTVHVVRSMAEFISIINTPTENKNTP